MSSIWSALKKFIGIQSLPERGQIIGVDDVHYVVKLREGLFCHVPQSKAGMGLNVGDTVNTYLEPSVENETGIILRLARIIVFWFFISMFFMLLYSWCQGQGAA